jgi:hypothetical protein
MHLHLSNPQIEVRDLPMACVVHDLFFPVPPIVLNVTRTEYEYGHLGI